MKKIIFIALSFYFTSAAYALFPIIDIKNINGDYLDETGKAHAEKAYYELPSVKIRHSDIKIKVDKKEKNLVISDPNTSVELDFDFSFLNVFKAFSFDNMQIKSDKKIFSVTSSDLDLYISPTKYELSEAYIETDVTNLDIGNGDDIDIADGLLLNGLLKIKSIHFSDFDDVVFEDLLNENPDMADSVATLLKKRGQSLIPMVIRFVNFQIKKGTFSGVSKIDSYINLWLRTRGTVKADREKEIYEVHLQKAKLGIFSIRGTIMKMIKKLNLDGVTVKGHKVYIDLSNKPIPEA